MFSHGLNTSLRSISLKTSYQFSYVSFSLLEKGILVCLFVVLKKMVNLRFMFCLSVRLKLFFPFFFFFCNMKIAFDYEF